MSLFTLLPCVLSSWSSDDSHDVFPPVLPLSCCLSERLQIHTSLFLNFIQPSYPWYLLLNLYIMTIFLAVSRRWFAIAFPPFCLPCPFVHPLADTIIVLIDCQKGY